jgi:hypothetical protein
VEECGSDFLEIPAKSPVPSLFLLFLHCYCCLCLININLYLNIALMSEPVPNSLRTIAIIGGGLAGSYAAVVLAKRGYLVKVFERRADSRTQPASWEGRSINLALSERGRHALRLIGLEDRIVEQCVPMHGRYVVWVVVILLHFVHFRSILKSLTNNPIQSINRLVE